MENQHKLIKGYRDLSEVEISAMNTIKSEAERIGSLIEELQSNVLLDQRWVAIAKTNLQQGFMAAVRSVAQPESF